MPFFAAEQLKFLLVSPGEAFKPAFETLRHFHHRHELNLRELSPLCDSILCAGCESLIQGQTFCCEECKYYLHRSCAELPLQVRLPFWHDGQHTLTLTAMTDHHWSSLQTTVHPLGYTCSQCRTRHPLVQLLSITPSDENDAGEVGIFAHEHPLRRFHLKEKIGNSRCRGCQWRATGELYGCAKCEFYLHERCFELLLREIQHPLHPDHPLKPVNENPHDKCAQCGNGGRNGLGYSCVRCDFYIDMSCADMTLCFEDYLKEVQGPALIRHLIHDHELTKFSVESRGEMILCKACHGNVLGQVFGCRDCLFFLHEECAEFPPEIRHYLHPVPPLTLGDPNMKSYHKCGSCDYDLYGLVYNCKNCSFSLHMECTLRTLSFIEQGLSVEIEHPVYKCAMTLFYGHQEHECFACGEVVIGPAYFSYNSYGHRRILHKSCAELSFDIQHPFHLKHPLTLCMKGNHERVDFQCDACRKTKLADLAYFCGECDFHLCVTCSSRELTLKHHLHEHRLGYFGETRQLKCNLCHKGCNADLYRCVPCNFNLHQDCLPLPRVVKCQHHIDQLVLYDSIIEDDSGEYYCDICEGRRDPDHGAFYCASCKMITDIKCVLPMIDLRVSDDAAIAEANRRVETLRAELKEAEERTADIIKKLEAAEKLMASLSS